MLYGFRTSSSSSSRAPRIRSTGTSRSRSSRFVLLLDLVGACHIYHISFSYFIANSFTIHRFLVFYFILRYVLSHLLTTLESFFKSFNTLETFKVSINSQSLKLLNLLLRPDYALCSRSIVFCHVFLTRPITGSLLLQDSINI